MIAAIAAPKSGFVASRGLRPRRPDPHLAHVQKRPPEEEVDEAGEREINDRDSRGSPKRLEILGGEARDREHGERDKELEKRREVRIAHAADCPAVERLKDSEAESGSRSQQRSRHG